MDAVSSFYNYGVACARTACFMDLAGDGIKEASKLFQQAGWCFEHMRTMVNGLQPSEVTVDFTSECLSMLSNLMLAQAQYLFYKKASDAGMKAAILSQIAMQVSEYFKTAYEHSQTNGGLKAFEGGKFANIMLYHSIYFEGTAYMCLANEQYKLATDKGGGMGAVCAYYKMAMNVFNRAQTVIHQIPTNYKDNFTAKYTDLKKMHDKAIHENKTLYFEKEQPENIVNKPEAKNFVKLEPALGAVEEGHQIEEKLRHLVPPEVRAMQEELRNNLQEIIN